MNVNLIDSQKAKEVLGLKKDQWVAPSVIVNTPTGLAVVCYEGVGWFEDEGMYSVLIGDEWNDWTVKITEKQLLSMVSLETTTLHKLIDPHNDRTRSNLWLWERKIKDTPQNVGGLVYN